MSLIEFSQPIKGFYLLTFNQPEKRNALSPDLVNEFKILLDEIYSDTSCKVLGITGNGNTFCSGADLGMLQKMQSNSKEENLADTESLADLYQMLWNFPVPTLGIVNGSAMAGGLGLLTTLDYPIAADDSSAKFGFSEVRIGFVPAIVANYLLRKLPGNTARWLSISGEIFSLAQAMEYGLIMEKTTPDLLMERATEIAAKIIKNNSREAMVATKALINRIAELPIDEGVKDAIEVNVEARQTNSCKEGIAAFLEKRKPSWGGWDRNADDAD